MEIWGWGIYGLNGWDIYDSNGRDIYVGCIWLKLVGHWWLIWVRHLWLKWVWHLWLKWMRHIWLKWVGHLLIWVQHLWLKWATFTTVGHLCKWFVYGSNECGIYDLNGWDIHDLNGVTFMKMCSFMAQMGGTVWSVSEVLKTLVVAFPMHDCEFWSLLNSQPVAYYRKGGTI